MLNAGSNKEYKVGHVYGNFITKDMLSLPVDCIDDSV